MREIGRVTILRDRFYGNTELEEDIMVPSGTYPILESHEGKKYFALSGYPAIESCKPKRIGHGLFLIDPQDRIKSANPVTFNREIVGDWEEFLQSSLCTDGSEEQRLKIELWSVLPK